MSPWPPWQLLAMIGCGLVAVAAAAGILTIIGGAILSRRAGGQPAAGAGQDPEEGAFPPGHKVPGQAPPPPGAAPAPALSREDVLHLVLWADEMRNRL